MTRTACNADNPFTVVVGKTSKHKIEQVSAVYSALAQHVTAHTPST